MTNKQNTMVTFEPAQAKELFRILGMIEKVARTFIFRMKESKISQWAGNTGIFVELDLEELLRKNNKNPLVNQSVNLSFLVDKNRLKQLNSLLGLRDIDVWYDENAQAYVFDNEYNRLDIPVTKDSQVFTQSPCTNLKPIGGRVTLDEISVQQITKYIRNHKPWSGHLLIYDGQLEGYNAYSARPFFFNPDYSKKDLMEKEVDLKFQISFFLVMMGKNEIKLNLGTTENESGKYHWLITESKISRGITESEPSKGITESKTSKGIYLRLTQELF